MRSFCYDFKGLKKLKGKCKVAKLGNVSSGEDDLRAIYGVRFILPRQNFSARLSGQDRVEGMIFGFSDPDEDQILFARFHFLYVSKTNERILGLKFMLFCLEGERGS
ncbi:MAG: hypothetical protein CMI29_07880 [Opitutae bacterium]|nr:hypothetical protein [Opitutae bacterium]